MGGEPSYHVIFSGKLCEGFERAQVKQTLAASLKLPPAKLEQVFDGKPLVLKRTASAEEAKRLVAGLARLGAEATIRTTEAAAAKTPRETAPKVVAATLPELPASSGVGALKSTLYLAGAIGALSALGYLLLLLTFSLGLLYATFFTTWGTAVTGLGLFALLLQLLVLPPGLVVLFLLAKPLLALRQQHHRGLELSREQEPGLHSLVAELCDRLAVAAPAQVRIGNDADVVVEYAGMHQVLIIGAPLVGACSVSQLAALIAHALLRLNSKGISPRAASLLHRSDGWLQRAVYGEDPIDRRLEQMVEEGSPLAPLIGMLQELIAASRLPLAAYLRLSRRLNRPLMHRLVYNADAVAQAIAGSDGYRQALEQQPLLDAMLQGTLAELGEQWYRQGRLPDNAVQAVVHKSRQASPDSQQRLQLQEEQEKAARLEPVPATSQRLQRLAATQSGAAYPAQTPAGSLFRDFTKLSRSMTLRLYYNRLSLPASPDRLQTSAPADAAQQQKLIDALFGQGYFDFTPLKLGHQMSLMREYEEVLAAHTRAQQDIAAARSQTQLAHRRCVENEQALTDIRLQDALYRAELWRQWGLPAEKKEGLELIHQACREQEKGLEENVVLLARQLHPHVQRLASSLALLGMPQARVVNHAAALQQEAAGLVAVLGRLEKSAPQLRSLRLQVTVLRTLLSLDGGSKRQQQIEELCGEVRQLLTALGGNLKTTPYPFGSAHNNLMAFALHNAYRDEGPEGDADRGSEVAAQITALQHRILARLCAIALHVEKGLGLK